jgi:hypothetical protein
MKLITKKFSLIYFLLAKISFIVKGISINHTMTHLKKFRVSGGTSNKVANLPIIKFPDQNKAAKVRKQ